MKITVNRFSDNGDATLSTVMIDGVFQCFGLEDEYRAVKVMGETRIPAGVYKVGIRDVGGFHGRYTKRFAMYPDFHKGMLQVLDVPGFDYILVHCGNTDDDTGGCLLVGNIAYGIKHTIGQSTDSYIQFYGKVIDAALTDNLIIEYVDN